MSGNSTLSTNSTNSTLGNGGINSTAINSTNINATVISPAEAVAEAEKAALVAEEKIFQFFIDARKIAHKVGVEIVAIWTKYHYWIIRGGAAAIGGIILLILLCWCCARCCKRKPKKRNENVKLKKEKPKKKLKRLQPNKVEKQIMKDLGTMSFSINYEKSEKERGMLKVKIEECENIPVHDISGYAYSFVVAKLLPLHENDETEHKTSLVRASFRPAFGDILSFDVQKDELDKQTLYLYQYELNKWSQHEGIGQISYELKKAGLLKEKTGEVKLKKNLCPYDPLLDLEVEMGAVFMNIGWDESSWDLNVEVLKADIIPQDDEDNATSYVSLAFVNSDGKVIEKHKTPKAKGLKPDFKDTSEKARNKFKYVVPDSLLPNLRMVLKLKQFHYFKRTGVIGKSTLECGSTNLIIANLWNQLVNPAKEEDPYYTSGWFPVHTKPKNK